MTGDNKTNAAADESIVPLTIGMRELRSSLIARVVRQSLKNYGHKAAESSLPECIAVDVERSLVKDEQNWAEKARDCGPNGGPLLESRDCIGSAYTWEKALNSEIEWQNVETAPKDGSRILGWCMEWSAPQSVQYYGPNIGWCQNFDDGPFKYQPTHWMPLPTPPKP